MEWVISLATERFGGGQPLVQFGLPVLVLPLWTQRRSPAEEEALRLPAGEPAHPVV